MFLQLITPPSRWWRFRGSFETLTKGSGIVALLVGILGGSSLLAQRQMEYLSRGLVAVNTSSGGVFLSWRILGTEAQTMGFNIYREEPGGSTTRITSTPIIGSSNFLDESKSITEGSRYFLGVINGNVELIESESVSVWDQNYLEIPIQTIPEYRPGDASVGDLNGDGHLEIVLHQTSKGRDNSHAGVTGSPILDAYDLEGRQLWRINLGKNIREGEHYTQFMAYDLDGDGRAEIVCKTADGTMDGTGAFIGDASKDWRHIEEGSRLNGRILEGPEYLTVFDGLSGKALSTVDYVPKRDPIDGWGGIGGNGGNDRYGNRCDRFLACVAYLDGRSPSVVMCRGVYGRTVLAAWDWRKGQLKQRWLFDSGSSYPPYRDASPFSGMGGHSLSVGDVDSDGKDEVIYQGMTVDDDGTGLYSTGRRHGDSMHLSDLDPERPGLELFLITENENETVRFRTPGVGLHDARTGKLLWSHSPGVDVGAGLAADIDPRYLGYEMWGGPGGLRDSRGNEIGPKPRSTGWAIWWDGDLLRELLDRRSRVTKWNWLEGKETLLLDTYSRGGGRGPNLMGDLIGDWREELLLTAPDGKSLRLYTTTILTEFRLRTLLHDPQYRLGIAWQNVVYNKPPHPSFFLGDGMKPPTAPHIKVSNSID